MNRHSRTAFVLFAVLVCALVTSSAAGAADRVVFRLNWTPEGEGEHAIFYVAHKMGYYAEQGLDVEIQKGTGSADTVTRVGAGAVDIGYADTGTIAIARAGGADLKIVAVVYQNSPFTVWATKSSGISAPKDLEGRTIGAPAGDAQRVMFPAFANATGIDESKITWVNISPAAKIQTLAAGRVDATVHFIDQLALYRDAIGEDELVYFRWSDYGVNPYGNAIFVTGEYASSRGDVIRRFLDATFKAWQWTIQNPRQAVEIVREYEPAANPDLLESMLAEEIALMDSESVREHGLGTIDPKRMEETVALIEAYFDLPGELNAEDLYTTEFLPHYPWPE